MDKIILIPNQESISVLNLSNHTCFCCLVNDYNNAKPDFSKLVEKTLVTTSLKRFFPSVYFHPFESSLIWFVLAFDIILVLMSFSTYNSSLIYSSIMFSLFYSIPCFKELMTIFECRNGFLSSWSKYATTCNKVMNAYYSLKRIPTIDEVKEFSNISYLISYEHGICFVICGIFIFACSVIPMEYVIARVIILGIALIFLFLQLTNKLRIFQKVYFTEPTDKEIELVLKCLDYALHVNTETE